MRIVGCAMFLAIGCGNDIGHSSNPAPDASGPPGSPMITVTTPRAGEAFYPAQVVSIAWTATDDDSTNLTCDVAAVEGSNRIAIATAMMATSGQAASATWTPGTAPPSTAYRIQVTCTDGNGLAGNGASGTFTVSPPPQDVSFATQVQPIFTASCATNGCHAGVMPQAELGLTSSSAYAALVDKPSGQCTPARTLVKPGAPDQSYLMNKLLGTDLCFGTRMPKTGGISAAQIQLIRDWIYNGAQNN